MKNKYDIENQNEIHNKWCKKHIGLQNLKQYEFFENTIKKSVTAIDMVNDE